MRRFISEGSDGEVIEATVEHFTPAKLEVTAYHRIEDHILVARVCRHGLTVVSASPDLTMQHGDNPEHRRTFTAQEILEDRQVVERWIDSIHLRDAPVATVYLDGEDIGTARVLDFDYDWQVSP